MSSVSGSRLDSSNEEEEEEGKNDISVCRKCGGGVMGSRDDRVDVALEGCETVSTACDTNDQPLDAIDDRRPSHGADIGVRSPV